MPIIYFLRYSERITRIVSATVSNILSLRSFSNTRSISSGTRPKVIITDGLRSYEDAYHKEFWTQSSPRTVHIKQIRLQGQRNNNKMERLNGEFRDREKIVRGIKKDDSPLIEGYQIYHQLRKTSHGIRRKNTK